mgnify:CR=1
PAKPRLVLAPGSAVVTPLRYGKFRRAMVAPSDDVDMESLPPPCAAAVA